MRQEDKREHRLPDDIPIGRGPRCFVRSAAVARNWAHDRHRSAWAEQPGAHAQRLSYAFRCPLPAPCAQAFDDSANVVPGIPPNGPSGLYFLDPNIVRPQATPLSPSRIAALGGSLTPSRSIRSAGVWCCNAGRHIATSHEMPRSKQYERLQHCCRCLVCLQSLMRDPRFVFAESCRTPHSRHTAQFKYSRSAPGTAVLTVGSGGSRTWDPVQRVTCSAQAARCNTTCSVLHASQKAYHAASTRNTRRPEMQHTVRSVQRSARPSVRHVQRALLSVQGKASTHSS